MPQWHIASMTLDEAMKAKGLTDQTLADKVGVSRVFITRIRNGKRRPSIGVAARLEAATGVKAAEFAAERAA